MPFESTWTTAGAARLAQSEGSEIMADYVEVNTDGIVKPVNDMRDSGGQITGALRDLQGKLAALGECWGDDVTGQQFLSQYAEPRTQLLGGSDALGGVVQNVADGLTAMAKAYQAVDDFAKQQSSQIVAQNANESGGGNGTRTGAAHVTRTSHG